MDSLGGGGLEEEPPRRRKKVDEGDTRPWRRTTRDWGCGRWRGLLHGRKADKEVTDRETSAGVSAGIEKADKGRRHNEWTTDREEIDRRAADRGTSDRRNKEQCAGERLTKGSCMKR